MRTPDCTYLLLMGATLFASCLIAEDKHAKGDAPPPQHHVAPPPKAPGGPAGQPAGGPAHQPAIAPVHPAGGPPAAGGHPSGRTYQPPNQTRQSGAPGGYTPGNPRTYQPPNQTRQSPAGVPGGYTPGGNPRTYQPPRDTRREQPGGYPPGGSRMHESPATARGYRGTPPPRTMTPVRNWQGRNGTAAQFGGDGRVRRVSVRDTTIIHGPGGGRNIYVRRADHTVIFTNGAGHGYIQRPFAFHGHDYARRTFYYNGRPEVRYYRSFSYRNVYLSEYAPVRYYSPVFYGWAYHPWGRSISFRWGWYDRPWYGYYGGYFRPYDSYPSAAFWLTDYLISASLEAAYQQRMDAQAAAQAQYQQDDYGPDDGSAALTPEVKQAIALEVQRQLALENNERQLASQNVEPDPGSSGLPRTLSDGSSHVFVVANTMDVSDAMGQSCVVSEGDVLQMQNPPPQEATAGFLAVMASKNQDCPRGAVVTVEFADLQEMQNHMRANIDDGLQQLQAQAGQGGLPPAPMGADAAPVQSAFAPVAPPADPNVASELSEQAGQADRDEQQVISESGGGR